MVEFVRPTEELILAAARTMRPADVREVWLSHHDGPERALRSSVAASPRLCAAMVAPEGPVCLFGVGSLLLSGRGSPWLLGTELMARYRREVAVRSRPAVAYMRRRWRTLENWVHADNIVSVRWLEACGFTLEDPAPFGPEGAPFRRFWMQGADHV